MGKKNLLLKYSCVRTEKVTSIKTKKNSKKNEKVLLLGQNRLQSYFEISLWYTKGLIQSSMVGSLVVVTAIAMLKKWNAMEQTLSSISLAHLPCSERIISLFLRHPIKSPNKYLNDSSSKPKNATHSAIAKFLPDNQFLFVMRG